MRTSCPSLARLFALSTAFFLLPAAWAEPANRYDLVGQVLEPLAVVFAPEHAGKAFAATLVLEEATGLPPEWRGKEAKVMVQPPGRAKISTSLGGQTWAVGRVGQEFWGLPGEQWVRLEGRFPMKKKKKKRERLPEMALPFSAQQLVFLPVLFQVEEEAASPSGARVLLVRLMPEIAAGLQAQGESAGAMKGEETAEWAARLSVREVPGKRAKLERLELFRPGWRLVVDVRRWALMRDVPAAYWQPDPLDGEPLRFSGADALHWWSKAWQEWLAGRQL